MRKSLRKGNVPKARKTISIIHICDKLHYRYARTGNIRMRSILIDLIWFDILVNLETLEIGNNYPSLAKYPQNIQTNLILDK